MCDAKQHEKIRWGEMTIFHFSHMTGNTVKPCRDFILRAVATFWAMSLVGIYPGRASVDTDTEGATESVHINGVSVLSRLNLEKM